MPESITPAFLEQATVCRLMADIAKFVFDTFSLGNPDMHVLMLVPEMKKMGSYPAHEIVPFVFARYTNGDALVPKQALYQDLAECKALQLWDDRNFGGPNSVPHLLLRGDTPYWGGVKRDGIVVACSGLASHYDRMLSSMVADACIAIAHGNYLAWRDANSGVDYVD